MNSNPNPEPSNGGRSLNALRSITTIGITAAATLVIARALKPPVMYCDVCGDETLRWMAVHRANERHIALSAIGTANASVLATVCPECSWDIYHLIDTAVRDVIDQARTPAVTGEMGHVRTRKVRTRKVAVAGPGGSLMHQEVVS